MKTVNKNIKIEKALLVLLILFILTSNVYTYAQVSCSERGIGCTNGGTPFCGYAGNMAVYPKCESGSPICCDWGFGCYGSSAIYTSVECTTPPPPPVIPVIVVTVPTQPTTPTCSPQIATICALQGTSPNYATCTCNPITAPPPPPTQPSTGCNVICFSNKDVLNPITCMCEPKTTPTSCLTCTGTNQCGDGKYCNVNSMCCEINPAGCYKGCYLDSGDCPSGERCISNCCTAPKPELVVSGSGAINLQTKTFDITVTGLNFPSTSNCSVSTTNTNLRIRFNPTRFTLDAGKSSEDVKVFIRNLRALRRTNSIEIKVTCDNNTNNVVNIDVLP